MIPMNTAVAAMRPAFAGFFMPALREGAREGIKAIGAAGTVYAVIGGVGAVGYGAYRGSRALLPATSRLLRRINPVRHVINAFDRRMEEAVYCEVARRMREYPTLIFAFKDEESQRPGPTHSPVAEVILVPPVDHDDDVTD
jgi:hypothetical protein